MKNKNKTVWGSRFSNPTSKIFEKIGASIDIDKRLFEEDIFASTVHVKMLVKKKIIEKKYIEIGIQNELFSFNEEIFQKYNQIDFAITRSGASTISELTFFNVPFLAIPLPESKDNHQFYNAKDYFDKKLCWLLNQSDYKKENLKEKLIL